jgi:hypothetical protein
MLMTFAITDPAERAHAMTKREVTPAGLEWKTMLAGAEDG